MVLWATQYFEPGGASRDSQGTSTIRERASRLLLGHLEKAVPKIHRAKPPRRPDREATPRSPFPAGTPDAELVLRARGDERYAEDAIFRRHAPMVTRLCARLMRRTGDADDAVQDTFVRAFAQLHDLRDPAALRPWLARIALHTCRRKLRKLALLRFCGLGAAPEDGLPLAEAHEGTRPDLRLELAAVEDALCAEPPELRAAWLLHRVEGLSIQETATACGRSLATVKRYVAAVDARLARFVGEPYAD
jgi:RNA polymerase sigma-70 factor (ECF subfamily)